MNFSNGNINPPPGGPSTQNNPLVLASLGVRPTPTPTPANPDDSKALNKSNIFNKNTIYKLKERREHMDYWLRTSQQANTLVFFWSVIWNVLAYAFTGDEDRF